MTLTGKQKNYLRGLAHKRQVVVTIGAKGLNDNVVNEIEQALEHHELIKIKLPSDSKQEKAALLAQISTQTNSAPVQLIGRVGILYRQSEKPRLTLPSI